MNEPIVVNMICAECDADVPADAATCPECGALPAKMVADVAANDRSEGSFSERRWFLICLMVFAALFLAFPLLWRSKAFSRSEKILWTLLVTLETVIVFAAFGLAMWFCWQSINENW